MSEKNAYNIPGLEENVELAPFTTFKVGGPARFFYEAKSKEDLIAAVEFAKSADVPFVILGAGSNIVVSDDGYHGLVIKPTFDTISQSGVMVKAGAGARITKLVVFAAQNGMAGLEKFAGLPGSVGGAVWANLGTMGEEVSNLLVQVEILDDAGVVQEISNEDCEFAYRDSRFKHAPKEVILSATFRMRAGNPVEIKKVVAETMKYKREVQDYEHPSAGSMFKNPEGESAGKLIDKAGLRGHKVGNAQISSKHGNFFINAGGAKAADVRRLVILAKERVKEQFDIDLEEEVIFLGDFD